MIVGQKSSSTLRDVIIGTAERLAEIDAQYRTLVRMPDVSMRRIQTNRSERWWIEKDYDDARAELIRRNEEHTIPYWARNPKAS